MDVFTFVPASKLLTLPIGSFSLFCITVSKADTTSSIYVKSLVCEPSVKSIFATFLENCCISQAINYTGLSLGP